MKYLIVCLLCCSCVTTADLRDLSARIERGGDAVQEIERTITDIDDRTDGMLGAGAALDSTGIMAMGLAALNMMRNRSRKRVLGNEAPPA